MLHGMRPPAWAPRAMRPFLEELALRWGIWRNKGTFWKLFKRWQLQGLFLLLMASTFWLAHHGTVWGIFLGFVAVLYLTRCFDETWPKPLEARARRLLARAHEAQREGRLNEALRLARMAEAMTNYNSANSSSAPNTLALAYQAWLLLLKEHGAEALQALARTWPHDTPSAALRVQAHLQLGESSIALALARRMFAQAPKPGTARLIAEALLQLQRPEEARHFLHLAGHKEGSPPATPPARHPVSPAPSLWEIRPPPWLVASWTLALVSGSVLTTLAVEIPVSLWDLSDVFLTHGLLLSLAVGGLEGGLVGFAQGWILRRVHPEAVFWPLITALGHGLGMMAVGLALASIDWQATSPMTIMAASMSLKWLVAMCFQALVLSRWTQSGATWMLAMAGLAPLAELAAIELTHWAWESGWLVAWVLYELPLGERVGQPVLRSLLVGLIMGGCGGALLRRELTRAQTLYPAIPPRPLTAQCPHVVARTRPCPLEGVRVPDWLGVAPLRGKLFCPGADVVFSLSEAEYTRLAAARSHYLFVIVPENPQAPDGLGEKPPRVGMLAEFWGSKRREPGEDYRVTVRMLARVHLHGFVRSDERLEARIEPTENLPCEQPQLQLNRLRSRLNDYIRSTPELDLEKFLHLRDPLFLADFIATKLELSLEEHRALLEDLDPDSRIARVCEWLEREVLEPPRRPELPRAYVTRTVFRRAWDE